MKVKILEDKDRMTLASIGFVIELVNSNTGYY